MSERANSYKIGLFVIVGTILLIAGLFAFGIRSAFEKKLTFETYVTGDATGLSKGSPVLFRGVEVGKVSQIAMSWNVYPEAPAAGGNTFVVVRCQVARSLFPESANRQMGQILKDRVAGGLRAVIQGQGITGTSVVALKFEDPKAYPPMAVTWEPKYFYIPSAPSQFGQILEGLDKTLAHLEKFDVERLVNSLDRTLKTADDALKNLGQLDVKGISTNIDAVAASADAAVKDIGGLAQQARTTLQGMRLETVGTDADRLLKNLDERLGVLIEKLSGIDVRALNETLAGTQEAARNLNEALEELKRYPSGFLFGKAPPPAAGVKEEKHP
jgi:ABC-type transporter Mla subunit MlaD